MKVTDPVCGTEIDSGAAGAVEQYEGRSYHFCCVHCRDAFRADPAKYAGSAPGGSGEHGCGHHGKHSGGGGHGCCH